MADGRSSNSRSKPRSSSSRSQSSRSKSKQPGCTSHIASNVYLAYLVLILLTVLFEVLPGVTGPGSKFYWVKVKYAEGVQGGGGTQWELGGLGVCEVGGKCYTSQGPPHWGAVQGGLIFHLAVTPIFFLLSLFHAFILWKPIFKPRLTYWLSILLPLTAFLFPMISLIIDFAVRSSISGSKDIEEFNTFPAFWLCIPSIIFSTSWTLIAIWLSYIAERKRRAERAERANRERSRRKKESTSWSLASLWPWARG
ncbi:hypothetical protein M231_03253 [Tremella mesenterica]|uniref:Uncharacterized protein n=1 Tax=Tremella mesenterica TaxID=5217 RepID=A0A4Q1BNS4_TREME|nr:hypothetical protein M231_03253 [Tremella mesenterica]